MINIKSEYNFLESTIKIDKYIEYAKNNKLDHLFLIDNNMYSSMEFYSKCKKNNIKPIIGLELEDIIILIKNYQGYLNLLKCYSLNNYDLDYENLIIINKTDKDIKSNYTYKDLDIKPIRCLEENDLSILEVLYKIKNNKDKKEYIYNKDCIFNNKETNIEKEISELCNLILIDYDLNLPLFSKYQDLKGLNEFEYLSQLSLKGLNKRLNNNLTKEYEDRLKNELDVINKMGYSNYFLIVYDYIKYAKVNDILVGPGRGSSVGSLVAYSLGITEVDPIKYNLLFERFLNIDRITMPDIDTDFQSNKRDEVYKYIQNKYGKLNVSSIITFTEIGIKSALDEVGRILKIKDYEIQNIKKYIKEDHKTLLDSYNKTNLKEVLNSDKLKLLVKLSNSIIGFKINNSVHACGIVISSNELYNRVPLIKDNDSYICCYESNYLEELGLLKMDLLSLNYLTIINDIEKLINIRINYDINYEDKNVLSIYSNGNTNGIFQCESLGMRAFLKRLKPKSFKDLVNAISLYRPGPKDNINLYIERTNKNYNKDSNLGDILDYSNGIMIYQEQIMLISNKIAGFTLTEADILRKAISKKDNKLLNTLKDKFINSKTNYEKEYKENLFNEIYKFGDYGFNKSHAVAYSYFSYLMAYLKYYYPKEFYSVSITSMEDLYKFYYEIKSFNIDIIKPNVLLSKKNVIIKDNSLVLPLSFIKGISKSDEDKILEHNYNDIYDFFKNTYDFLDLNKYKILIKAGSLDCFNINKRTIIENLDNLMNYVKVYKVLKTDNKPQLKEFNEYENKELINYEKELFNMYISNHPVLEYKSKENNIVNLIDIKSYFNEKVNIIVMIDNIKEITTKKGDKMAFIQVSDEESSIECTCFSKTYLECNNLKKYDIIKIEGKVERTNEYRIVIDKLWRL